MTTEELHRLLIDKIKPGERVNSSGVMVDSTDSPINKNYPYLPFEYKFASLGAGDTIGSGGQIYNSCGTPTFEQSKFRPGDRLNPDGAISKIINSTGDPVFWLNGRRYG